MKRGMVFGWAVAIAVGASPAWAGVKFETQGPRGKATTWAEGKKLRVEQEVPREPARVVLIDGGERSVTLLNAKTKTYQRMELDKLKAMAESANQRMEQAMAGLPPEQRAKLEAMRKKSAAPAGEVSVSPLGKSDTVAGYDCAWSRVTRGEKTLAEVCHIPFAKLGLTAADLQPAQQLMETLREVGSRFGQPESPRPDWEKAPGFPGIRVGIGPNGERKEEERLVKLEKLTVPAERLGVPKDYTAQPAPGPGPGAPPAPGAGAR